MRPAVSRVAIATTFLTLAWASCPRQAFANPEPTATYDARVAAMGGVAIPTLENAAALYHNPAQLSEIGRYSLNATLTSLLVNLHAPFAGIGSDRDSGLIYAPLMFAGGAFRVHERVTLGLGAYVTTGFGGGFDGVPCISTQTRVTDGDCEDPTFSGRLDPPVQQEVLLFIAELAVPIQVNILPNLSIGVSLRLPWGRQRVGATQDIPNGDPDVANYQLADQAVDGFGIPGVLAGITYRPTSRITLAATYRSQVHVDMTGTTTARIGASSLDIPTSTRWYVPHMFRVGAAIRSANQRLVVGGEFKVQFHSLANQRQVFELDNPLAPNTIADFSWQNVYIGVLGAEYLATPKLPIRIGMSFGRSASISRTLTPFSPPPGIQFGFYGGAGYTIGNATIDFAFGWGGGPAHERTESGALCGDIDADSREEGRGSNRSVLAGAGCPGTYDVDSWFLSLSASYAL